MFGVHGSICVTLFVSIVLAIHLVLHYKNVKSKLKNYFDLKVYLRREDLWQKFIELTCLNKFSFIDAIVSVFCLQSWG
jgi:hypothetical protein